MSFDIRLQGEKLIKAKLRQKRWRQIVGALAAVVVFVTTYALVLPAITMEREASCGLEEHVHTDECYTVSMSEAKTELICTKETLEIHKHTKACYDDDNRLICGYADFIVHTHDASCYDASGKLICTLPEVKEHVHDSSCYDTDGSLLCERAEISLHKHTEKCYDKDGVLVCGMLEVLEHQHTDECFKTTESEEIRTLTCGLEEHKHTEACYPEDEDAQPPQDYTLTATTADGVKVVLTGAATSFDLPLEELSLSVNELFQKDEAAPTPLSAEPDGGVDSQQEERAASAFETIDSALQEQGVSPTAKRLFDIRLMHGEEEIQPVGPVTLTFSGIDSEEPAVEAKVYHIDETDNVATDMPAALIEDGSVEVQTTHFSLYGIVLTGSTIPIVTTSGVWDNRANGVTINLFDYLSYQGPNGVSGDPTSSTIRTLINTTNGQSGGTWRNLRFLPQGSDSDITANHWTGTVNARQGITALTLDNNGYPTLSSAAGSDSLRYLFDPTVSDYAGTTRVRYTYADVNKLFKLDADGYVVYDSNVDYAYYNTSTSTNPNKEFSLDSTYQISGTGAGFFPFDAYNTSNTSRGPTASGTPFNHHFGMTLEAKFKMPKDGKVNGNDMVFRFGGDDDMWVFINNQLVLDIGGIHNKASGYINFATGAVEVETGTVTLNGATVRGAKTTLDAIFGANYFKFDGTTEYTIRCFYLERGGYDSNLSLSMNFPMGQTINIPVGKVWDDNSNAADLRPASVIVHLFADGVDTGKTLTLNAANSWKSSFDNLPLFGADGVTEVVYALTEDPVPGYSTAYRTTSAANTNYWVPATSLTAGENYLLVYNNNASAISHNGASPPALVATNTALTTGVPITVGTTQYDNYIYNPPTSQQWTAAASGNGYTLRSVATPQSYITYGGSGSSVFTLTSTTDGSGSAFSYSSNRLSVIRIITTSYLQNYNTRVTSTGSATSYTLYRQVKASETLQLVSGVAITNTYVPTRANLSLLKVGAGTPTVNLAGVKFELYTADASWAKTNAVPYATGITGSDGKLTLSNLIPGQYLLYETETAEGYRKPDEPWQVTVSPGGVLSINGLTAGTGGVYTITNAKLEAQLVVEKQWLDPDGTAKTEGLPESIQVELWRKWETSDSGGGSSGGSHTVNFIMPINNGAKNVLLDSQQVADGGSIVFYGYVWSQYPTATVNGTALTPTSYTTVDYRQNVPVYTLSSITADQDVILSFLENGLWDTTINDFVLVIVSYTQPEPGGSGGDGTVTAHDELVETVTLNAAGEWKYEWNTLDVNDPGGNPYSYYVKEIIPDGYAVSYFNNGGIAGGLITITNQTSYVLPDSGGGGTLPYTVAGVLMLGAGLMYSKRKFRKGGRESP